MTTYACISLATGEKYLNYWYQMAETFKLNVKNIDSVTFHLLTDNPTQGIALGRKLGISLHVHAIPSYKWPEATLLRYKEISRIQDEISSDVLIYLDADMLIMSDFISFLNSDEWSNGIALVSHPGYWRSKTFQSLNFYLRSSKNLFSDLYRKILIGGLGTWETNAMSKAFVPRSRRKTYVCGGTWFGKRAQLISLIEKCAHEVDIDFQNGIIAKWHDESHLNKWLSVNEATLLEPSFCFDPTYKNLRGLPEYIRAVRK